AEPPTSSSGTKYGAPPVPEPLDVQGIINDPCNALTDEQLDNFPGTLDEDTEKITTTTLSDKKTGCNWIFQGDRYSYGAIAGGVALPRDIYHGLSSIYRAAQKGKYDTFRPVETAGYPAAVNKNSDVGGECRLSVGLRNDTAYRITTGLSSDHPEYEHPCESAKKLASFVV